jgi:hypothetical protein
VLLALAVQQTWFLMCNFHNVFFADGNLQVSQLEAAKEMPPPKPPSPVDAQTFAALCAAPPLQVRL